MRQSFRGLDANTVRQVCCIGAGPIGAGWTAYFLARGYTVSTYLHEPGEEASLRSLIDTAWISLESLGLAQAASRDNLTCTSDLAAAVRDAEFVQESAPENLELKQSLYEKLGRLVPANVVIASSTSGLPMSDIQASCATPERTVVGHPFNPPYLLPLVEIIGGAATDPAAVRWLADFYRIAGKAPLVLKKEIPGFIATRLQEAVWREALHMIANDEASVEDIDFAIVNGPGPRWAMMGPCLIYHVGGGEGGMAYCLDQFGPALKLPWSRLEAPDLTPALRQKLIEGTRREAGTRDYATLNSERDRALVAIQK
ncbi:MAG: 3-hydroxyacyl-CoA dehydrogenase NAD-binding domain-containing protein, partial [Gammaproteobacteria bacterium]|nr:3-hydroxyacyl-CoA dehydrogenase NAD-binding domain-containing protein [Gammaproteobacteria bacterium]